MLNPNFGTQYCSVAIHLVINLFDAETNPRKKGLMNIYLTQDDSPILPPPPAPSRSIFLSTPGNAGIGDVCTADEKRGSLTWAGRMSF